MIWNVNAAIKRKQKQNKTNVNRSQTCAERQEKALSEERLQKIHDRYMLV